MQMKTEKSYSKVNIFSDGGTNFPSFMEIKENPVLSWELQE